MSEPCSECCSVMQCVAVCCSVLQCVAVCCSVLQCVAVCCSAVQLTRNKNCNRNHCPISGGKEVPVTSRQHRDTYGQAQVCSKVRQGSSIDRPCQPSFCLIKSWHVRNPLPQSIRQRLSVLVRYWGRLGRVKFILQGHPGTYKPRF